MSSAELFVGIDACKASLDVATRPSGDQWTAHNDERGIRQVALGD